MIAGRDSATPPNQGQVAAAQAAGIQVWGGYIAVLANVGLLRVWSREEFSRVQALPGQPIGFCSGWDDPARLQALASAWGVRLCLDLEGGIRGNGPWVDGFLRASGAGLYGNLGDLDHAAPFYIMAAYPGRDPGATWAGGKGPAVPHGWQWQGTHSEFGLDVDSIWLDDWFGIQGGDTMASAEFDQLQGELQSHDGAIRDLQTREASAEGSLQAHDGAIRDLQARLARLEGGPAGAVPPHSHPVIGTAQ